MQERRAPSPSSEVKAMLGEATVFYVHQDLQKAISLLTEIIRIDPNVQKAWHTLATCHDELGNVEKSLQLRIVATQLEGGRASTETWKQLGQKSRDLGLLQQAIYCFGQAAKVDKDDVVAIWDKAVLLKETGNQRQVRRLPRVRSGLKGLNLTW